MRSQIKLGSLFGIKIGLHYSWFLIAFLIVVSLVSQFRSINHQWSNSGVIGLALATGALFFVSLLLHELAHSMVAKSRGLPVREITFFALGGISQIEKNPTSAKTEFWMALVGPLTSAVIGAVCLLLRGLSGQSAAPAYVVLSWLGYINLGLAVFNMVPGYPLDGGRILRAAIWWVTGNLERSTRAATRVGQVVGGLFIALGILRIFGGAGFGGLWIAFIGWFLLQAAGESYLEVGLSRILAGVTVNDVMSPDCPVVDGHLNVLNLVDQTMLRTGDRCFAVMDRSQLAGVVTTSEVNTVERARWPFTTVFDIMRPVEDVRTVQPETPLKTALEIMSRENLPQLPVLADHRIAGLLTRARVLSYLHNRMELKA